MQNNDQTGPSHDDESPDRERQRYEDDARRRDALCRQMLILCAMFFGGSMLFANRLMIAWRWYSAILLFLARVGLGFTVVATLWARLRQTEAQHLMGRFFATGKEEDRTVAEQITQRCDYWLNWTFIIFALSLGLAIVCTTFEVVEWVGMQP